MWSSSTMQQDLLARPGHILVKPKNRAGATFSQTQVRKIIVLAEEQSRRHLLTDTGEERIKSSQRTEYCTLVPSQAEPGSKQC